jgi:hypothetical protein
LAGVFFFSDFFCTPLPGVTLLIWTGDFFALSLAGDFFADVGLVFAIFFSFFLGNKEEGTWISIDAKVRQ